MNDNNGGDDFDTEVEERAKVIVYGWKAKSEREMLERARAIAARQLHQERARLNERAR